MKMQSFGSTELTVSEYGLGCARIGGIFQRDAASFLTLLSSARDAGINFFDTADMYSQGESESLIGRAFRGLRHRVIIASKAGYKLPGQRRLAARLKPFLRPIIQFLGIRRDRLPSAVRGSIEQDFSPAYLERAVEASLRRLRTDYIDLLQLHSPPTEIVERGEWQAALEKLKHAGKIRYYGVSCDALDAGLAALRYPGVSSIQFPFNLLEQAPLERLLPEMHARHVAGIARECLANGLLVKPASEVDLKKFCHSPEQEKEREQKLTEYREAAATAGHSLASHALDFVTRQSGVSVTLIGVSSLQQLKSLLAQTEGARAAGRPEQPLRA